MTKLKILKQSRCLYCDRPLYLVETKAWCHEDPTTHCYAISWQRCKRCGWQGCGHVTCPTCGSRRDLVHDHGGWPVDQG
jgi:hypothetical protein